MAALLIVFVQPAAVAWLATTDSLSAGLNVRAVLGTVRRNVGGYVLVILVATAAFVVGAALSAGLIWPFWQGIGRSLARHDGATFFAIVNGVWLLVFAPYLRCVEHHLYGQAFVRANR